MISSRSVLSYDPITGKGAIGVEFAGTAVTSTSSFGSGITPARADVISAGYVAAKGNEDLQWSEGSYRGFFTLTVTPTMANATYYAMSNVSEYTIYYSFRDRYSKLTGRSRLRKSRRIR